MMREVVLELGVPTLVAIVLAAIVGIRASAGEATFRCAVYEPDLGAVTHRTVAAPGPDEAFSILEAQGLLVDQVRRVWPIRRVLDRGVHVSDFRKSIPQRQIADMAESVATLLENNITIQDALPMYARQKPDNKCRAVLRGIEAQIAGGAMSIEDAFSAHADEFGKEVATMIRVGAMTEAGTEGTFRLIAQMSDRRAQFGSQVKKALIEPAMIGVTIFALLLYMSFYVLPQFKSFYAGYGSSLPWITTFTLSVTDWCTSHLWLLFLAVLSAGTSVWWLRHQPRPRLAWDHLLVGIPIYGRIVESAALGRVMGTVSTMIPVGVPLQVALPDSIGTAKNSYIESVLADVTNELGDASFQEAVRNHAGQLPDKLVSFVETGAAAGALDEILSRYARITSRDVDLATESLQSVLKTTLIMLVGIPAAWIMAAMWWPMIFYIRIIH